MSRKGWIKMVKSMFSGVAGLRLHQQKMDVIGNNIANVNTYGYKSYSTTFQDSMYMNALNSSAGVTTNGGYGGVNASQVGYGVKLGSISANFSQGGASPTNRGLDCMIDGSGFFIVGPMKDGTGTSVVTNKTMASSGLSLSRVGQFYVDSNGYLVDSQRNYVYGYPATKTGNTGKAEDYTVPDTSVTNADNYKLEPLRIPLQSNGKDRYELQSYTISQDGTISGVIVGGDEANKVVTLGKIALASVENPDGLEKTVGFYYRPGDNAGTIVPQATAGGQLGDIKGGYLEMANVDLAKEFSDMITTQRGFQANSKIITVTDEMLQELVNMKR